MQRPNEMLNIVHSLGNRSLLPQTAPQRLRRKARFKRLRLSERRGEHRPDITAQKKPTEYEALSLALMGRSDRERLDACNSPDRGPRTDLRPLRSSGFCGEACGCLQGYVLHLVPLGGPFRGLKPAINHLWEAKDFSRG